MPITADLGGKQYTLGRGRVFVDRYPANVIMSAITQGEGERYVGNTPEFSTNSSSEDLDHYDSDGGVRVKDDSVQLSFDRGGAFTLDSMGDENIAMYFLSDGANSMTQAAATGLTNTLKVKRGRFYQLGASSANPSGLRNVTITGVTNGGVAVLAPGNWELDEVRGRFYVENLEDNDIEDDDTLIVTFSVAASTRSHTVSKNNSIYAAVRYIADNPKGPNRDFYFPYVKLAPDGDYAFKGDDWQTMSFTMEILKKASNIESVYIDGQPVV